MLENNGPISGRSGDGQSWAPVVPDRRGMTTPAASKNQPVKMYQAALLSPRDGIGSEIGNAANTPIIARQPAMTNKAIFGACSIIDTFQNAPVNLAIGRNHTLNAVILCWFDAPTDQPSIGLGPAGRLVN
jgi:hypothetical protein